MGNGFLPEILTKHPKYLFVNVDTVTKCEINPGGQWEEMLSRKQLDKRQPPQLLNSQRKKLRIHPN